MMNTQNTDLLKSIQTAVAASPELQTQLTAATTTDQVASLLSSALSTTVSKADLTALSESAKADMTDQQLDAVSAGGDWAYSAQFWGPVSVALLSPQLLKA